MIAKTYTSLLLIYFLFPFAMVHSQERARGAHYLGASISALDAYFHQKALLGTGSKEGRSQSKFGLHYTYQLNERLGIESGIQYLKYRYDLRPAPTGIPQTATAHELQLLSVPVYGKFSFLRFLYLNGGVMLDIEAKNSGGVNSQSGIGAGVGIGAQYYLKNGIGFFLNPQLIQHRVIGFHSEQYPNKLTEASASIGISYKLSRD
ncbi:outer membrane beta-barrel protein [Olivibacter sitiensis]|uniref:outer membrane beta-barrel protein n=1 Tax=Olivibacter sitiensis TaxID=376470 RepID=UPI0003F6F49C|nr:outer membrane beta-barrel protein [Olivibacter sitiensis]